MAHWWIGAISLLINGLLLAGAISLLMNGLWLTRGSMISICGRLIMAGWEQSLLMDLMALRSNIIINGWLI